MSVPTAPRRARGRLRRERLRRPLGALILLVMALSAIYGGGFFGVRDRFPPPATRTQAGPFGPAIGQAEGSARQASTRRSQPYWRPLERFTGTGPLATPAFSIDDRALQWRVKWRCERGRFRIQPQRPSGDDFGHALADTDACPRQDTGVSAASGGFRLNVQAAGPWEARVEQQLDVPLVEPPTPEMTSPASRVAAAGDFYDIDEHGLGKVEVHRHRDGSATLRLEGFYVTPNLDLELRLSHLERPKTTEEVVDAPYRDVGFLKATAGSMNYRLPPGALSDRVRSVVIWCEITHNAYAAATLRG